MKELAPNPIRVALVEDHPIVRDGIRRAVSGAADIQIVAEVGTAAAARRLVSEDPPDVAVLDWRLPDDSGITLLPELRTAGVRVVMLTCVTDERCVREAVAAGVSGFLCKASVDGDMMVGAIRGAVKDIREFSPEIVAALVGAGSASLRGGRLTHRELQVWRLVSEGLSNTEIAGKLFLSERTVKYHVGNLLHKLGARTRAEATAMAYRDGYLGEYG